MSARRLRLLHSPLSYPLFCQRKGGASCYSASVPRTSSRDRREEGSSAEWQQGCTNKMDARCLSFQLLLLAFPVVVALEAYSGTTVAPHSTTNSSESMPNTTYLDDTMDVGTRYTWYAQMCWFIFVHQMTNVSEVQWCEWMTILRPYNNLKTCLEHYADWLNYSFPNTLSENYFVNIHRTYFLNCPLEHPSLMDPPEHVLLPLIITPICLIPLLVTLVVLKSKDSEMKV